MTDSDLYKLTDFVSGTDCGKTIAFFIRWHVSPIQAKRVIAEFAKNEFGFDDDDIENLGEPTFERWRSIPGRDADGGRMNVFKRGTGRGSFPVSVISLEDWSR